MSPENRIKIMASILSVLCIFPALALTSTHVIDCGANKAAPFDETVSPDGRYAMGWTLLVRHQNAKPVDWSHWKADDPSSLVYEYISDPSVPPGDKDDYAVADCVIDLKDKHILVLSGKDVYFPNENHTSLAVEWSKPEKGRRYALVPLDVRFNTSNLWLITFDSTGIHPVDLAKTCDKAVDSILRQKVPLTVWKGFLTFYSPGGVDPAVKSLCFSGSIATLSFESEVAKSETDPTIDGTILLRLPDGLILHASSDTPGSDPMQDQPDLAQADQQLNLVYQKLEQKLNATQRADLKKEQLAWIRQRNEDAATAQEDEATTQENAALAQATAAEAKGGSGDGPGLPTPHAGDQSLLTSTQKRSAELSARLKAFSDDH